jgi:hypothetical protein
MRLPAMLAIDELHLLWRREMVVGSYRQPGSRFAPRARHRRADFHRPARPSAVRARLTLDEQVAVLNKRVRRVRLVARLPRAHARCARLARDRRPYLERLAARITACRAARVGDDIAAARTAAESDRDVTAAVDADRLAGHVRRLGDQEVDGLCDVVGSPSRLSGVCEMIRCRDSSSNAASSGQRIGPARSRSRGSRVRAPRERARHAEQARLGDRVDDEIL